MKDVFVKKYWNEEGIMFYLHFQNGEAVRQVQIMPEGKLFLTSENPQKGDSMLYDQSFDQLDLQESDFITEKEFNKIWMINKKQTPDFRGFYFNSLCNFPLQINQY